MKEFNLSFFVKVGGCLLHLSISISVVVLYTRYTSS